MCALFYTLIVLYLVVAVSVAAVTFVTARRFREAHPVRATLASGALWPVIFVGVLILLVVKQVASAVDRSTSAERPAHHGKADQLGEKVGSGE